MLGSSPSGIFPALAGVLLAGLLSSCASRPVVAVKPGVDFSKIRRVALLGFDDFPRRRNSGDLVGSMFEKELVAAGYSVVERRRVAQVLSEQRLSVSGAVEPRLARKLGKILGVDAFILGSVTAFQEPEVERYTMEQEDVTREPIVRRVTRRKKNPLTGETVSSEEEEVVGYNTTRTVRQVPQTRSVAAQIGIAARMVEVTTGEVLWVGSATDTGFSMDEAAQDAAHTIMEAVRPTWPDGRLKGETGGRR
ncbi:MAG: hypothetical protein HY554_03260 [Elusimicrobia bacterium]|nr:hypothetical protein [Elusimicrobiota bacterium]